VKLADISGKEEGISVSKIWWTSN